MGKRLITILPDGDLSEFMVPGATGPLTSLTAGPDGNVWFVDGSNVGKITPAGVITEYPVATSTGAAADLSHAQLITGPDGNLWFLTPGELDRITPAGIVSGLPTPTGNVTSLGVGNDGNLWIAFQPTNGSPLATTPGEAVARMSTSGQTTVLSDRLASGQTATAIAGGPDGSLWINDGAGAISRINLAGVPTVTPPMISPVSIGELATDAGKTVSGVIAVFTPADSTTTAADYTATIDWGDGTVTGGALIDGSGGDIDVTGSHTYATALTGATEQASITVTGPNGGVATIFAVTQVANAFGNVPYPSLIGVAATTATSTPTSTTSTSTSTSTTPATGASSTTKTPVTGTTTSPGSATSTLGVPVTVGTSGTTSTSTTPVPVSTAVPTNTPTAQVHQTAQQKRAATQALLAARREARAAARLAAVQERQALLASRKHKS